MDSKEEMPNKTRGILAIYKKEDTSNTEIVLNGEANLDIQAITESLANKAQNATSVDEINEIVNIIPKFNGIRSDRIEEQLKIAKTINEMEERKFDRKMKAVRETFRITASVGSVAIGLYLIPISPLLSPLLITLGIAGALNYQLKDVTDLAKGINNSNNGNQDSFSS